MAYEKIYVRNDGQPTSKWVKFPSRSDLGLSKQESITEDRKGQLTSENRDEDKRRPSIKNVIFWLDENGERKEKVLDYDEYFPYVDYPHICEWNDEKRELVGIIAGGKRLPIIRVGEIVEIENMYILKDLMKRFGFVNQVDKEGAIVVKNIEGVEYEKLDDKGIKQEFLSAAQKAGLRNYQI